MRPTELVIDVDAIAHNAQRIREVAGGAELCAVIKADAYGHGAAQVARALRAQGVQLLAVALVEEGRALRAAGILGPILVLGADYQGAFDAIVALQLTPAVGQPHEVDGLSAAAARAGKTIDVHLEVDTGMARLGADMDDVSVLAERIAAAPGLRLTDVMTHLSHGDDPDPQRSRAQIARLEQAWQAVLAVAPDARRKHIASSGALATQPFAPFAPQAMVRCGLVLFGIEPLPHAPIGALTPAMTWRTRPIAVRQLPVGATVSYGGRWRAERPSTIATLPVGYADGYPRLMSSKAEVLIRGQRAKVVGTICMDLCMVDVTDLDDPQAPIGLHDEVVLMGAQGAGRIDARELGTWAQTITYEIIAGIGARVPRTYRGQHVH